MSHAWLARNLALCLLAAAVATVPSGGSQPARPGREELLVSKTPAGNQGGRLIVSQRGEPKTLNPVLALDLPSREVIYRLMGDLVHIDRSTLQTQPALATSWAVSPDLRRYTLNLRRGIKFSDGFPFTADDVTFSFKVYLDEKVGAPQRDLLVVENTPIQCRKIDDHTVMFELARSYAAAERIFDSIAILPRHLLEKDYQQGLLRQVWSLNTPPDKIAGLGPFQLHAYVPGQQLVLRRNPFYWKSDQNGNRLPYLDEVVFVPSPSEDAQVMRFQSGEVDIVSRVGAQNFSVLQRLQRPGDYKLFDLGPGFEYNFLFFNLNDLRSKGLTDISRKQSWFRQTEFRQAVSAAIDRQAITQLVYKGRAAPLAIHVTPANTLWVNRAIAQPQRSLERARKLLESAGFSWKDGALADAGGQKVEFSILTSAGNTQRGQMATIIQDDLKQLGMTVNVVSLEFRTVIDRALRTYDYEAAILSLASGDADPNSEMNVMLSSGRTHIWNVGQSHPATAWEAEIDRLMKLQLITPNYQQRKRIYDRVQQLMADNQPMICLASPNILVAAREKVGNLRPVVLDDYVLWNAEQLFIRKNVP
ncbi:MAG TPA: ABC transporter substrate-binding protein [Acidobacteriota bacterium]|jgi:peptide/nickel transport system substrate-binding protein